MITYSVNGDGMRRPFDVVLLLLVGLTAGCDPAAGVAMRQRLAPTPQIDCVRAALAASPMVTQVGASTYYDALPGYQFQVVLHDSVAPRHAMAPRVQLLVPTRDSATLEVSVRYFGATTGRITAESGRQLAAAAELLMRLIHSACTPETPMTATCHIVGAGRARPCAPGA